MQPISLADKKAAIILNSMSGMTDHGEDYVEHYLPGGSIVGTSKAAGRYGGKWSSREDGLRCFRYGEDALADGCGGFRAAATGSALRASMARSNRPPRRSKAWRRS